MTQREDHKTLPGAGLQSARHAACALALAAMVSAPVLAQPSEASSQTRDMILGPLQSELEAPVSAAPAIDALQWRAPAYTLRYAPSLAVYNAPQESPRPAASLFAGSLLTARTGDPITRDGLSTFSAAPTLRANLASGGALSVWLINGETPGPARLSFDPDYAESAGRALTPGLGERQRRMAVSYERSFDAPGGADGLDIGLNPRAGVSIGDSGPAARAGATVRLGQYVSEIERNRPAWWLFAGADRQAVLYDPGQGFDVRDALAMQPYAMVGDAQAGVAVRVKGADLSLAYVHRETRYSMPQQGWETSEGFAAFSLTWKH